MPLRGPHSLPQPLAAPRGRLQAVRDSAADAEPLPLVCDTLPPNVSPPNVPDELYDERAPDYALPPASRNVFERLYGVPVVRQRVNYQELLCDIRNGRVRTMHSFTHDDEGSKFVAPETLVEYQDGTLKQTWLPDGDIRCGRLLPACAANMVPTAPGLHAGADVAARWRRQVRHSRRRSHGVVTPSLTAQRDAQRPARALCLTSIACLHRVSAVAHMAPPTRNGLSCQVPADVHRSSVSRHTL
jgi:hypothetical protein